MRIARWGLPVVCLSLGAFASCSDDPAREEIADAGLEAATPRRDATAISDVATDDVAVTDDGSPLVDGGVPGAFDTTFGSNGVVVLDVEGRVTSLDFGGGQFLLSGNVPLADGGARAALARTDALGVSDPTFGNGKVAVFPIEGALATAARMTPTQEIWIGTRPVATYPFPDAAPAPSHLYQVSNVGDRDPSMQYHVVGSSGCTLVSLTDFVVRPNGLFGATGTCMHEILPNRRAFVLLEIAGGVGFRSGGALVRAPDAEAGPADSIVDSWGAQSGVRTIVSGATFWGAQSSVGDLAVAALHTGDHDDTFGANGVAVHPSLRIKIGQTALAIAPDDSIYVAFVEVTEAADAGLLDAGADAQDDAGGNAVSERIGVMKLTADGQLDTSFGSAGFAFAAIGDGRVDLGGLALHANGELYVVGSATKGIGASSSRRMVVAAFGSTGALNVAFGESGVAWASEESEGRELTFVDNATKLVVGGTVEQPSPRFALWRIHR